ncbi:RNA polymerase II-associated protein [Neolentinus lepideus HHB14362 ss-1]|uniref:RNA polymerase II-associated protein n=1 Tax=Neolentinus lepideus HHB14362 ss-1 TaxID=1314782 RepID=A0A165V6C9_9AGAM|nr:RNA polymerase II-associated protein [Neolentinus lepideus HHB14362 ss-1]
MSLPDALLALRHAVQASATISYKRDTETTSNLSRASHINIPPHSFPKSTPTRFLKPGASPSSNFASDADNFFSLEAVYLAWLLKDAPGAEYMKAARENGLMVGFVSVTERKALVEWLEGKTQDHDRIVPLIGSTTPPGSPRLGSSTTIRMSSSAVTLGDATASPSKRRYVADAEDVEVVKKIKANEIELRDRNTVLRGIKPNNFASVRDAFADKLKKLKESSKPGAAAPAPTSTIDPKLQARKARNMEPIIMISSSPTALITLHNVKRFLQEAVFEPSAEARARATSEGNTRPEDLLAIYRTLTNISPSGKQTISHARYFVVDSVEALSKFGADAWDRVICVMTTGQAWQFRPYKWNDPRQLFHHVKGIYFAWTNDPPNPKIKDWNVTELKIDPHRRHVDKSVVAHFWKILDTWTLANKPWLMKTP